MTWQEDTVKAVVEGYQEQQWMPNLLVVRMRDGKTGVPLAMPYRIQMELVKETITLLRSGIEEVALIINAWESEVSVRKVGNIKPSDVEYQKMMNAQKIPAVIIMFESRKEQVVRRFRIIEGKLVEQTSPDVRNGEAVQLGLYIEFPEAAGRMFA